MTAYVVPATEGITYDLKMMGDGRIHPVIPSVAGAMEQPAAYCVPPYHVAGLISNPIPAITRQRGGPLQASPAGPLTHEYQLSPSPPAKGFVVIAPRPLGRAIKGAAYRPAHDPQRSREFVAVMHYRLEGTTMPTYPRLSTVAADETLDTQLATRRVTRLIVDALANGHVSTAEAEAVLCAARQAEIEANEAAVAAEHADIGELIAVAHLTGEVSPRLLRRAERAGMPIIMLSPNLPRRCDDDDEPLKAA